TPTSTGWSSAGCGVRGTRRGAEDDRTGVGRGVGRAVRRRRGGRRGPVVDGARPMALAAIPVGTAAGDAVRSRRELVVALEDRARRAGGGPGAGGWAAGGRRTPAHRAGRARPRRPPH